MLVSQLILALQAVLEKEGDLPVGINEDGIMQNIFNVEIKQVHPYERNDDDYTAPLRPVVDLVLDQWEDLGEIEKTVDEQQALIKHYIAWSKSINPRSPERIEGYINREHNQWSDAAVRRVLTEWMNTNA